MTGIYTSQNKTRKNVESHKTYSNAGQVKFYQTNQHMQTTKHNILQH